MNRLRKLAGLSARERGVLAEAALLLLVVEGALRALPVRFIMARLEGIQPRRESQRLNAARVAWLVDVAARYSPLRGRLRPTCLRKSLVIAALLRRDGADARLVIGARSPRPFSLEAHAWVELDGEILGSRIPAGYHELKVFETLAAARPIA